MADGEREAEALWGTLQSPNESDSNGEPANVVDGLYSISRAIHHLARAIEGVRTKEEHDSYHASQSKWPEPEDRGLAMAPKEVSDGD